MKKNLLLIVMALLSVMMAKAETCDAVYAWVNGESTCYRLEAMPQVTYSDGAAVLTVDGEVALTLPLQEGAELIITYGQYEDHQDPTAIDAAQAETLVKREGKMISGGRLIIVRDGKQYDISGRCIE